jgi:uncharacterized membrane protein (UPF0127 family)
MRTANTGYAFNVTRQTFLATELRAADSHRQRLVGLIGTPKSAFQGGAGLWISPCHGVHTMFMRYPIDVVYLDTENCVIRIEDAVRPWRMTAILIESATVIELPAHTAWGTGTIVGDQLEIKIGNMIHGANGNHSA